MVKDGPVCCKYWNIYFIKRSHAPGFCCSNCINALLSSSIDCSTFGICCARNFVAKCEKIGVRTFRYVVEVEKLVWAFCWLRRFCCCCCCCCLSWSEFPFVWAPEFALIWDENDDNAAGASIFVGLELWPRSRTCTGRWSA